MSYRTKRLWENTNFYCGNHDDTASHPMEFQQGSNVFYACPNYKVQEAGDRSCPNRLSVEDAEGIISQIDDRITSIEETGMPVNIRGFRFDFKKKIAVKVLNYEEESEKLDIAIVNHKAIRSAGGKVLATWA